MAYQPPADISRLSPPEVDLFRSLHTHAKVLIAQACYAKGNRDFQGVSQLLRGHVLLKNYGDDWYDPRVSVSRVLERRFVERADQRLNHSL